MHTHFLTLVYPYTVADMDAIQQRAIDRITQNQGSHIHINRLSAWAVDILFCYDGKGFALDDLRTQVDCGMGTLAHRQKKVFVSDMDSTMIAHETLDEVADYLGLGEKISAITARTMAGELPFEASLRERVRLLAGKDHTAFDVIHQRLQMNKGAATTLRTLKQHGVKTALVSGGFDVTVDLVAKKLGFDYSYGNTLQVTDGIITGTVLGTIVDAEAKQQILLSLCEKHHTTADFAIAIGDGANDLPMIHTAGTGIGYMGKPIVRQQANFQINLTDLTSVLYFIGIKKMIEPVL